MNDMPIYHLIVFRNIEYQVILISNSKDKYEYHNTLSNTITDRPSTQEETYNASKEIVIK